MLWYPRVVFEKIQKIQKSVQRSTSVWYLFIENQWACSKIVEFICICDSDIFVYLFVHIYFHRLKQWKGYIYVVQFILFLSLLNYILCCCHFWSNHFTIYNKDTSSFLDCLKNHLHCQFYPLGIRIFMKSWSFDFLHIKFSKIIIYYFI